MAMSLPKKIKNDAIVEALFEIQFDSDDVSEIIIGRLSDSAQWNEFTINRLGVANLPENIRATDPSLRYQAVIERRSQDNLSCARIGSNVLSYHIYSPYLGWTEFESKLISIIELLYEKSTGLKVTRLGFRYVNFLRSSLHNLSGISDLSLNITLQDQQLVEGIDLSYVTKPSDVHQVKLRVASPSFIHLDKRPDDMICIADIDVFSPLGFEVSDKEQVIKWLKDAHDIEKQSFFSLFSDEVLKKLVIEE